ncbi:MAG TPA: hypothetical protein VF403_27965 [Kofleriaceae bacterium]
MNAASARHVPFRIHAMSRSFAWSTGNGVGDRQRSDRAARGELAVEVMPGVEHGTGFAFLRSVERFLAG